LLETPGSELGSKRQTDSVESLDDIGAEIGEASITKPVNMVRVKIEQVDGK